MPWYQAKGAPATCPPASDTAPTTWVNAVPKNSVRPVIGIVRRIVATVAAETSSRVNAVISTSSQGS